VVITVPDDCRVSYFADMAYIGPHLAATKRPEGHFWIIKL
jgi:hypothetical protein